MSLVPPNDEDASDRAADAMKTQLRKDVASWSAARGEAPARHDAQSSAPAAKQPSPPPSTQAKKSKPAAAAAKPAGSVSKPFAMSYDGVTTAEHIKYMIARGAR